MVSKNNLAKFQGKVFLLGTIVIAVLIIWSLFGNAFGVTCTTGFMPDPEGFGCIPDPDDPRGQIPFSNILDIIATLLEIPFELLLTIVVLIVAVIIAIPIIVIVWKRSKRL